MLFLATTQGIFSYTGRFFRAEAESRRRELGDEGDASVPTLPLIRPRPYGNELPCPVQDKPPCERGIFFGATRIGKNYVS
jgi:hypothetical protein